MKSQENKLIQTLAGKNSNSQQLANFESHSATMSHRLNSGEAEVHDGSGVFVIGGNVVGAKTPGRARCGDPLWREARTRSSGERITYLVVKVRSR
ncbi:MAG: hypothetical protein ACREUU_15005 [Gammaproteobacteria bacterium]